MPIWFLRDQRDHEIIEDLERGNHSDRALAVMSGSFLEDALKHALQRVLKRDDAISRKFLDTSFDRNILLGYLLQLYSDHARHDLYLIKQIRNEFAHQPDPMDFSKPPVRDHIRNLRSIARLEQNGYLHGGRTPLEALLAGGPPVAVPTENREKFLITVQIIISLLGVLSGPSLRDPEF